MTNKYESNVGISILTSLFVVGDGNDCCNRCNLGDARCMV